MSTPEKTRPLHELIASDEYWAGPVYDPERGLLMGGAEGAQHRLEQNQVSRDSDKAQEIGRLVISFQGGGSRAPLSEGSPLPIPDPNSRQIIRLVRDSRCAVPQYLPKTGDIKRGLLAGKILDWTEDQKIYEGFDKNAKRMEEDPFYLTGLAFKEVRISERRTVLIGRDVFFARGSKSGNAYAALNSMEIASHDNMPIHIPALAIGAIYKERRAWPKILSKIVAADIIEPHGVVWQEPPKGGSDKKGKEKGRRAWLPRTANMSLTPPEAHT